MPAKRTLKRARQAKREGKAASTQAGEFVHEEIEHIREGKHGARSTKQAIAIGLSKARRAGVDLPPPEKGKASTETRRKAQRDLEVGATRARKTTTKSASSYEESSYEESSYEESSYEESSYEDGHQEARRTIEDPLARHHQGAQAREPIGCQQVGVVEAGEDRGPQAYGDGAFGCGQEGGADQGCGRSFDRGTQGRADTRTAQRRDGARLIAGGLPDASGHEIGVLDPQAGEDLAFQLFHADRVGLVLVVPAEQMQGTVHGQVRVVRDQQLLLFLGFARDHGAQITRSPSRGSFTPLGRPSGSSAGKLSTLVA